MKKLNLDGMQFIKDKIELKLFNSNLDVNTPAEKAMLFEQYKMVVESAQKIEERRKDLNSIFITINWIFFTVLSQMTHLNNVQFSSVLALAVLLIVAIVVSIHWLIVISSYKHLNYINYALLRSLENLLPTAVFSLRTDIMSELEEAEKGNVILEKETLIPKLFLIIYFIYLGIVVFNYANLG